MSGTQKNVVKSYFVMIQHKYLMYKHDSYSGVCHYKTEGDIKMTLQIRVDKYGCE